MLVKDIKDEDFINYKKPSMLIAFPYCSFKCDKECGRAVCQNSSLANEPNIEIGVNELIKRYLSNPITKSIVCAGLEPCDSIYSLYILISFLRSYPYNCNDDVVIYTGYTKEELKNKSFKLYNPKYYDYANTTSYYEELKKLGNVVIKYGRYIPDQEPHYDEVLGVNLASDNQYAERL